MRQSSSKEDKVIFDVFVTWVGQGDLLTLYFYNCIILYFYISILFLSIETLRRRLFSLKLQVFVWRGFLRRFWRGFSPRAVSLISGCIISVRIVSIPIFVRFMWELAHSGKAKHWVLFRNNNLKKRRMLVLSGVWRSGWLEKDLREWCHTIPAALQGAHEIWAFPADPALLLVFLCSSKGFFSSPLSYFQKKNPKTLYSSVSPCKFSVDLFPFLPLHWEGGWRLSVLWPQL